MPFKYMTDKHTDILHVTRTYLNERSILYYVIFSSIGNGPMPHPKRTNFFSKSFIQMTEQFIFHARKIISENIFPQMSITNCNQSGKVTTNSS